MLTLNDIGIASYLEEQKIKLPQLGLGRDMATAMDYITFLAKAGQDNEIAAIKNRVEELDKSVDLKPLIIGKTERIKRLKMEEKLFASVLPVALKKTDPIYTDWVNLPLTSFDHALSTYTLRGNRTYQEKPYMIYFRKINFKQVERMEEVLQFYLDHMTRLKEEMKQDLPNDQLFSFQKLKKKEALLDQWEDIAYTLQNSSFFIFDVLDDREKEALEDRDHPLSKMILGTLVNYTTPSEAKNLKTKTLFRFVR